MSSLYIGITLAIFHSLGNTPLLMDKFITRVKDEDIIGEASFNSLHDISSKPVDLFTGSDWIRLYTIVLFVSVIGK